MSEVEKTRRLKCNSDKEREIVILLKRKTPQESRVLFGLCFKNKDNVDKLHREAEGFNPISGT